jgi:hypothetical protein
MIMTGTIEMNTVKNVFMMGVNVEISRPRRMMMGMSFTVRFPNTKLMRGRNHMVVNMDNNLEKWLKKEPEAHPDQNGKPKVTPSHNHAFKEID